MADKDLQGLIERTYGPMPLIEYLDQFDRHPSIASRLAEARKDVAKVLDWLDRAPTSLEVKNG